MTRNTARTFGAIGMVAALAMWAVGCGGDGAPKPAGSAGGGGTGSGQSITLPDPCTLVTTADVEAFIGGYAAPYWAHKNLSAGARQGAECVWTFDQVAADGTGTPLADRFSVMTFAAATYGDGTGCAGLAKSETAVGLAMVALPGIGDCAFGSAMGTMFVVVGRVIVMAAVGGGIDSTAPWQDVDSALARTVVAALGG